MPTYATLETRLARLTEIAEGLDSALETGRSSWRTGFNGDGIHKALAAYRAFKEEIGA